MLKTWLVQWGSPSFRVLLKASSGNGSAGASGCKLQLHSTHDRAMVADHPAGSVAFCDSASAFKGHLREVIREVSEHRGIQLYENAEVAMAELENMEHGKIVCIVAARMPAIELARFLRTASRKPWLRSLPLIVLSRDQAARRAAARVGSIVITDVEKLADHILSLPSKSVIASEVSACQFKGLMCDMTFGHLRSGSGIGGWKFSENTQRIRQGLSKQRLPWYPESSGYDEHIDQLASYFAGLQPVHRCSPGVFLGMLRSGGLMSRTELEAFVSAQEPADWARQHMNRHAQLQELCNELHAHRRVLYEYTEQKCVEIFQNGVINGPIGKNSRVLLEGRSGSVCMDPDKDDEVKIIWDDNKQTSGYVEVGRLKKDLVALEKAVAESRELSSSLKRKLPTEHHARIDEVVNKVALDMITASKEKIEGVGYRKDRALGTHRHVFATLGVNGSFGYGSVVIILKPQILYHPDCWISPLAATGYVGPHYWVFRHRPWSSAGLAAIATDPDVAYPKLPDMPDSDNQGVEACIQSSFNAAATAQWHVLMAREAEAMCHYLCYGHREPTSFDSGKDNGHGHGKDWGKPEVRTAGRNKCQQKGTSKLLPNASSTVIDFYETRDSHTQFECHLPGIVPLGAIDKVIIRAGLYQQHSKIKERVDSYVFPDGRRLSELVIMTESPEQCMKWQHDFFDRRAEQQATQKHLDPRRCHPVSVRVSGRVDRPVFLPCDFGKWFCEAKSFRFSFCTRCSHDIRVYFSSTSEPQHEECDLSDRRWKSTTYMFAIGFDNNRVSYISKGMKQTQHCVQVTNDSLVRCTTSKEGDLSAIGIWDRYWFEVELQDGKALLWCGRGPFGENVMMRFEDTDPIRNLQYIGLGCWREPTIYCDLQVSSREDSSFTFHPPDRDDLARSSASDRGNRAASSAQVRDGKAASPAPDIIMIEDKPVKTGCKVFWW